MNPDPYAALLRRPEWFQQLTKGNTESQWQPIPSRAWTLAYYIVLLLCGLPIGGVLYAFTLKNITLALRYDNFNEGLTDVERMSQLFEPGEIQYSLVFIAEETMNAPVYVYYELTDFYQNHKRFVRSRNPSQLGGLDVDPASLKECDPYRYLPKDPKDPPGAEREVIFPCGLVAHSYFNDTFELSDSVGPNGMPLDLEMKDSDIATEWDRRFLYADKSAENFNDDPNARGGGQINGFLSEDEHFMVWMRVGAKPDVRKLYGIIHNDIPKGSTLTFNVINRYNTYDFSGEKRLVLLTTNWTGAQNKFLGVVYFIIGSASAVACVCILIMDLATDRKYGNLDALSWNKNK